MVAISGRRIRLRTNFVSTYPILLPQRIQELGDGFNSYLQQGPIPVNPAHWPWPVKDDHDVLTPGTHSWNVGFSEKETRAFNMLLLFCYKKGGAPYIFIQFIFVITCDIFKWGRSSGTRITQPTKNTDCLLYLISSKANLNKHLAYFIFVT